MSGESDDDTTESAKTRYPYTNDWLAGILLMSLPAVLLLQAAGMLPVLTAQVFWVYASVVLLAAVWTFGTGSVTALKKLRE